MSRISSGSLSQMTNDILKDLYSATEKRLEDRAIELAKKSQQFWISSYEPLLKQLPDELISKIERYRVNIQYPWDRSFTKDDLRTESIPTRAGVNENWNNLDYIKEVWVFTSHVKIPNPVIFNSYGGTEPATQELHPDMREDAEKLCKEKLKLIQEKMRMINYLTAITDKNKTHRQLREVFPSNFHRYLPAETVRKKALKKEARHVEAPNFLGERQTINLLEDN